MTLLRDDLLRGRAVALGGGAQTWEARLAAAGARVEMLPDLEVEEEQVGEWSRRHAPLDAMVYDASGTFAQGGTEALVEAMQRTWSAVREVATGALIPGEGRGKIVLVASSQSAPAADALRDALENLARTLSVEWARYGLTAVAVIPSVESPAEDVAELVCFLCSEAGDYFSGCRLEMSR